MDKIDTGTWKKTSYPRKDKKYNINFLYSIKMSQKTLKFDIVEVNKKEFHASKQPIALNLKNVNQILISDKCKHSDTGYKCFTGNKDDNFIRPLCIILPQMSGNIKYFDNGGKNISLMIEDDSVLVKYNDISNIWTKKLLSLKFHGMPVHDEKYVKAKVKEFNDVDNTNFWGWWDTKRRYVLHLFSLYKYWLCYENRKKELSITFFRRTQV